MPSIEAPAKSWGRRNWTCSQLEKTQVLSFPSKSPEGPRHPDQSAPDLRQLSEAENTQRIDKLVPHWGYLRISAKIVSFSMLSSGVPFHGAWRRTKNVCCVAPPPSPPTFGRAADLARTCRTSSASSPRRSPGGRYPRCPAAKADKGGWEEGWPKKPPAFFAGKEPPRSTGSTPPNA